MSRKNLPVGIQSFEKIRENDYLYVDKTGTIYELIHDNVPYFLSRPRRFGKSLLISTLKAYWEGRKELFSGLEIERLEKGNPEAWKSYPVFCFDFNGINYQERGALEEALDSHLRRWERTYGCDPGDQTPGERFRSLLIRAREQTSLRSVILIDEYDKPLLDVIGKKELREHNKEVFRGFFSTLKSFDSEIQFVFITGVSKFHKVSIFSDLNQLTDISLSKRFAGICGITEKELETYFREELDELTKEQGVSPEECRTQLRQMYDGYHFHPYASGVYNPYSLLNAFFHDELGSYWFETGTPSFLISRLRENQFDVRRFTNRTIYANEALLKDYTGDELDPVPLLYQTGYLTIVDYDRERKRYTLGFPNEEVKYGFLESLMPSYAPKAATGNGLDIFTLDEYIENGHLDQIRDYLTALFANLPYTLESDPFEHDFQTVIYLVFELLGKLTICEQHTFTGRIDCSVQTRNHVYLFEFKRDDTAQAALAQINSKDYSLPFVADSRTLHKIGVSFDSASRRLVGWETETVAGRLANC